MANRKLSLKEYIKLCSESFKINWRKILYPIGAVIFIQFFLRLDFNYTESLPDHVFLTVKNWKSDFKYGDYVAYRFPSENSASPFRKGDHMIKLVVGLPGDKIFINEKNEVLILKRREGGDYDDIFSFYAGKAKTHTKTGRPIETILPGIIPEGQFYVYAPHPDSLDSRYSITGLLTQADILGKSFSLF